MYSKVILSSFISFGQSFEPSCCTLSIRIIYFNSSLVQDIIYLPAMTLDYVILFLNVSIFFASGNLRFCLYFIFNISFTPWHTYSCVNCVISTIIWKFNRILTFIVWDGWVECLTPYHHIFWRVSSLYIHLHDTRIFDIWNILNAYGYTVWLFYSASSFNQTFNNFIVTYVWISILSPSFFINGVSLRPIKVCTK